jgi:hypothetical protein
LKVESYAFGEANGNLSLPLTGEVEGVFSRKSEET